ncbi:hypothetical protein H072_90 [Dactylellina haptotyla CBS 200.50]|uniref:Uncharacterized protein n=1 Tax=Dactylellina haptotyla (strain CBS 200.50) TaxID=1284197 RepID=S8AY75_DACHA|nr:hypothetical protein H072_90 [Dactylellina haptotyla CBS 200.50]
MSIEPPRPDPSACLLLLPFLLPPRTRVFLRELLKKNPARAHSWSSKAVARPISSCSIRAVKNAQGSPATSSLSRGRGYKVQGTPRFRYNPHIVARHYSSEEVPLEPSTLDENPKSVSSDSPGKGSDVKPRNAFERLENKVGKEDSGGLSRAIKFTPMENALESDERSYQESRKRTAVEEELIRTSIQTAMTNTFADKKIEEFHQFWNLLREETPNGNNNNIGQTPPGPGIRLPNPPVDNSVEPPDLKSDTINFRVAPLDEYIVFAPPFSSEEEKEDFYALYAEKFLPPHLQQFNTYPTPPVKTPSTNGSETPEFVDMPFPSVFGTLLSDPSDRSNNDDSLADSAMHDLEVEWDARWTTQSYSKLLYTLEIAREDGIDVLNSLLLSRRQREVLWIAKRVIDKHPQIQDPEPNVWGLVNAVGDQDDPKRPSISNSLQDGMILYPRDIRDDIARRRRGVGVLLSSITSMLLSGWKAEQRIVNRSIFDVLTEIDTPPILDTKDATPSYKPLFSDAFSHVLSSPGEEAENKMEMTGEEIFSTVLQLLAYLHVEKHVPPIVYSEKHPRLQHMQSEISRLMSNEVETAYYSVGLGFQIPKTEESPTKIDWSLWLELVNCIAAERGLGVSATWLLLRGEGDISWERPAVAYQDISAEDSPNKPEPYAELDSRALDKKLVLPSYLVPQAAATCLHNAAFDAWPPETPGRMLRLLKTVANTTSPYDASFARELLDHPEVNMHASYADQIPEIPIKGKWSLDVYYQILMGACHRKDLTAILKAWVKIEDHVSGESNIMKAKTIAKNELPPVRFAPIDGYTHPVYLIIASLSVFRSRQRYDLMRYLIRSYVREDHVRAHTSLLNLLFAHAGDLRDFSLAKYLLSLLTPPLPHRTITTVLNMHLALGQQREAQAILDFMKRSGIEPDHVDLGIITRHTFKQSHAEGFGLMRRAATRAEDHNTNTMGDKTVTKTFREGVELVVDRKINDPIGPNAWYSVLVASVRENNREKAGEALKALGLDLGDPKAAGKMGTRVFNALISGVVKREGSLQGMRMFKLYCLPPKKLKKLLDESIKSHRSGDRRTEARVVRNKAGIKTSDGVDIPIPNRTFEAKRQEHDGVVVPDDVTLKTIVHQASKEKRDYFGTKRILSQLPMKPAAEKWMKHNAYFETSWHEVMEWAHEMWTLMDYGEEEWVDLATTKLTGKRVPRLMYQARRQELSQENEGAQFNLPQQDDTQDDGSSGTLDPDDFDEERFAEQYNLPDNLLPPKDDR